MAAGMMMDDYYMTRNSQRGTAIKSKVGRMRGETQSSKDSKTKTSSSPVARLKDDVIHATF